MATHNQLGKEGEKQALLFLQKNGYEILETNWRYLKAEIDIICKKQAVLVCVEVKTRTSNYHGNPQDAVSPKKIKLLVAAANEYVLSKNLDVDVRFDVVAITKTNHQYNIEHLKDAFLFF